MKGLTSDAILYYIDNPVDFVEDIIGAKPDVNQKAILNSLAKYPMTSVRSGHGIGKSAVEAWAVIWFMDNNRKKVQSSFLLPDIYVGYTTDFNRATAQTAQEVTEKQVFQPERRSLAWAINNRLLNGYAFQYVEAFFQEPNISNPDDICKIMTAAAAAGGLTPNKAKEILYKYLGEASDDYEEEWGNVPLTITQSQNSGGFDLGGLTMALEGQIKKAEGQGDNDQVVAVMKEVRGLLLDLKAQQEEDEP